jgi:hypothetical protein
MRSKSITRAGTERRLVNVVLTSPNCVKQMECRYLMYILTNPEEQCSFDFQFNQSSRISARVKDDEDLCGNHLDPLSDFNSSKLIS